MVLYIIVGSGDKGDTVNKKGFTLIELLAVIVILGVLSVFIVPNVIEYYRNSKIKSEEIFKKRMIQVIDNYVSLNNSSFNFHNTGNVVQKCNETSDGCYNVNIYQYNFNLVDVVNSKIIAESDLINPNGRRECNLNTEIKLYRDSDYVYCFEMILDSCIDISNAEINTCEWN